MKKFCCVPFRVSAQPKQSGAYFHRFPRAADDAPRKALRTAKLQIEKVTLTMQVCPKHFAQYDYCLPSQQQLVFNSNEESLNARGVLSVGVLPPYTRALLELVYLPFSGIC